ncbi:MAG: hypothetical protein CMF46_05585 [Legionellales bacterium]|nr:hypothetical protein [Legionellales bacterium]|tara:strand:- start:217 stop:726 length:510 start_codon:yes stop_codon:yes gene_type:complete
MNKIITHSHCIWQNITQRANLLLEEPVGGLLLTYLTTTLENYHTAVSLRTPEIIQWVNHQQSQSIDIKTLADSCLVSAGLFPQNSKNMATAIPLTCHMGSTAYHTLYVREHDILYQQISHDFIKLVDILLFIAAEKKDKPLFDQHEAYSIWTSTNSQYAKEIYSAYKKC